MAKVQQTKPDKEITKERLIQLYIKQRFSISQIAYFLNSNNKKISRLLKEHDIPKRKHGEIWFLWRYK